MDPSWITAIAAVVSPILAAVWIAATVASKAGDAYRLARAAHERLDRMMGYHTHRRIRDPQYAPLHWRKPEDEPNGKGKG